MTIEKAYKRLKKLPIPKKDELIEILNSVYNEGYKKGLKGELRKIV